MADTTRDIELRLRASDLSTAKVKEVIATVNDLSASLDKQLAAAGRLEVKEKELRSTLQQLDQAAKNVTGLNALIQSTEKLSAQVTKNQGDLDRAADALRRHREAMEAGTATGRAAEVALTGYENRLNAAKKALDLNSGTLAKYRADLAAAGVEITQFAAVQQQLVTTASQIGEARTRLNNTIRDIPRLEREAKEATRQSIEESRRAAEAAKAEAAARQQALTTLRAQVEGTLKNFNQRHENHKKVLEELRLHTEGEKKALRERHANETLQARATTDALRNEWRRRIAEQKTIEEKAISDGQQRRRRDIGDQITARPGARGMAQVPTFLGLRPYELTNLGYQVNDVISGLVSGQNATQILAQQGGQFIQIFGRAALRWFPAVAAAAGVAAVAISAITQAFRQAASEREFAGVITANTNAIGLNKTALTALRREIQDLGVSWEDAGKVIRQGIEANLRPELLRTFATAAHNIAEVTGKEIPEAMADLIKGTTGGRLALEELLVKYPALTREQRQHVRELINENREREAGVFVLKALAERFEDAGEKARSPFTEALRDLAKEWRNFLDVLAETGVFQDIIEFLRSTRSLIEGISETLKDITAVREYWRTRDPNILADRRAESRAKRGAATQVDTIGLGPPETATSIRTTGTGDRASIAAEAISLVGLSENRDRAKIREYLTSGGSSLDPATVAWCAAFANAVLARKGFAGTGSNVATSFLNFGTAVQGEPQAGDILVQPRGNRAGQTGGHVGFATGETRTGSRGLQFEMVSGNSGAATDQVTRAWVDAAELVVRRATEAASAVARGVQQPGGSAAQQTAAEQSIRTSNEQLALARATSEQQEIQILYEQALRKAKETTTEEEAKKVAEAAVAVRQYQMQVDEAKRLKEEDRQKVTDGVNYNAIQAAGLAARAEALKKGIDDYKNLREIQNQGEAEARAAIQKRQQENDTIDAQEKRIAELRRGLLNQHKSDLDKINEATNLRYDNEIKRIEEVGKRLSTIDRSVIQGQVDELNKLRQVELEGNVGKAARTQANEALSARRDIIQSLTRLEAAGEITITEKEAKIKEAYDTTREAILGAADALEKTIDPAKMSATEVMKLTAQVKELRAETKYVDPFWKGLKDTFSGAFTQGLDTAFNNVAEAIGGAIAKTKEWKDVWTGVKNAALNFFATILREIATYILKAQAAKLASQLFGGSGGGGGGIGGILSGLFGGGGSSAAGVVGTSTTGAVAGQFGSFSTMSGALLFRKGGIVGRDGESWWDNAPRYRTGTIVGLAPDEQRAILHRGEEVLSADNPRNILNGGGRGGSVNIRNVLVDDQRKIAEAMGGAHGERVIVQAVIRNGATIREIVRG